MGLAVASALGIDEYLSNPEFEHFEYVDERAIAINLGTGPHSQSQANCGHFVVAYLRAHKTGYPVVEMRCRLKVRGNTRFYLPDVSVILGDRFKGEKFLDGAPELVVEVRSPDDSISSILDKMNDYFANGTRIGWIIFPEERSVWEALPDRAVRVFRVGDQLEGGVLLPGLAIPVTELFE